MREDYKILIADDEALWANLIKSVLESHGYNVIVTTKASEIVDIALKEEVDLILLDITFPDMNGLDICKSITTNPETEHIGVILLTSQTDPSDVKRGLEAGANDYVEKQASSLELIARMQAVLKNRKKYISLLFLKSILENSPYPVFSICNDQISFASKKIISLLKYTEEEFLKLKLSDMIYEDEYEDFLKHVKDIYDKKSNYEFPYKFVCKDGEHINLLVHMVYLDSKKGVAFYCNTFV